MNNIAFNYFKLRIYYGCKDLGNLDQKGYWP